MSERVGGMKEVLDCSFSYCSIYGLARACLSYCFLSNVFLLLLVKFIRILTLFIYMPFAKTEACVSFNFF